MRVNIIGNTFCLVIFSNILLYEASSIYTNNPYGYSLTKRDIELDRRGFLQSFCLRRCSVGQGGNLCRCNGFHFAGKRTSNSPTRQAAPGRLNDEDDSNDLVYKILARNNAIKVNPDLERSNGVTVPRDDILKQVLDILPHVTDGDYDSRELTSSYDDMIYDILRSDDM